MLINLDNEVHFKKVFTDVEVFKGFVKDVLGLDLEIDKVETEKSLSSQVGATNFRMDLFAEDTTNRTVVEIQKVDYDYTYRRFLHYFLGNLVDVQLNSGKLYKFNKDVYVIVVVTRAYQIAEKGGEPIKDDVLITDINPRTLEGEYRDMHDHKMVMLNTEFVNKSTPKAIRDWLDLIKESIHNPKSPNINLLNPAVARAAKIAENNNITPEEFYEANIQEMRKATLAINLEMGREEQREKTRQAEEKRRQAEEKRKQAEGKAKEAEGKAKEAQGKAKEAEVKAKEAEGKAKEAEGKAKEAEGKAKEAQGKAKEAQERVNQSILRALNRGKLTKAEIAEDFGVTLEYIEKIKR